MFARAELLFEVELRPIGATSTAEHFRIPLVFFSAFERTNLTPDNPMQRHGDIIQLYEPGPWPSLQPILHVGFVSNILCRAPLMPCFIGGSISPTIPFSMRQKKQSCFLHGRADSRHDRGDGSLLYEVNTWMWKFGRGMKRTVSVAEAQAMRTMASTEAMRKRWDTRKRNRETMQRGHGGV